MNVAINYIEEHILEEIDYGKLGRLAGCSSSHFQRIFTYLGGVTLKEYIKRRRMSLAATELADSTVKVIDVALKYGYSSPTAFTRAFADIHGVTPSEGKGCGVPSYEIPDGCERSNPYELQNRKERGISRCGKIN